MITLVHKNHFFKILYPEIENVHPDYAKACFKRFRHIIAQEIIFQRFFTAFKKKMVNELFFIFEIDIECTCSHPGFFCNLAHGNTGKAFLLYQQQYGF